jgi:hypothetical protein
MRLHQVDGTDNDRTLHFNLKLDGRPFWGKTIKSLNRPYCFNLLLARWPRFHVVIYSVLCTIYLTISDSAELSMKNKFVQETWECNFHVQLPW